MQAPVCSLAREARSVSGSVRFGVSIISMSTSRPLSLRFMLCPPAVTCASSSSSPWYAAGHPSGAWRGGGARHAKTWRGWWGAKTRDAAWVCNAWHAGLGGPGYLSWKISPRFFLPCVYITFRAGTDRRLYCPPHFERIGSWDQRSSGLIYKARNKGCPRGPLVAQRRFAATQHFGRFRYCGYPRSGLPCRRHGEARRGPISWIAL